MNLSTTDMILIANLLTAEACRVEKPGEVILAEEEAARRRKLAHEFQREARRKMDMGETLEFKLYIPVYRPCGLPVLNYKMVTQSYNQAEWWKTECKLEVAEAVFIIPKETP